jgi:FdhE protein
MDIKPIDFQAPTEEAPQFLLPVKASVFAERAERFNTLAEGHSLHDWLRFLGRLSTAQHEALQLLPELPLPDTEVLRQAQQHGMPPLNAIAYSRPDMWRTVLKQITAKLEADAPETARAMLQALREMPDDGLEKLASDLLKGNPDPRDAAELTIVAAALQVVWTALAGQLAAATLQRLDTPGVCPCCGSLPVSSIVRLSPAVNNLRYLHCSLCNTEWNVTRATCTACDTDKSVAYQQLEDVEGLAGEGMKTPGAMRAEACDSCKSYLKIAYQEKDPHVDPVADDLATLALDMLMDEAGYSRSGPNLLLIGGAG